MPKDPEQQALVGRSIALQVAFGGLVRWPHQGGQWRPALQDGGRGGQLFRPLRAGRRDAAYGARLGGVRRHGEVLVGAAAPCSLIGWDVYVYSTAACVILWLPVLYVYSR